MRDPSGRASHSTATAVPARQDTRLLPVALVAWGASLLVTGVPALRVVAVLLAVVGVVGAGAVLCRGAGSVRVRRVVLVAALALSVGLGVSAAALVEGPARHPAVLDARSDRLVTVVARVDSAPLPASSGPFGSGDRVRFRATASSIDDGTSVHAAAARLMVFAARPSEHLAIGSTIEVRGTVHPEGPSSSLGAVLFADQAVRVRGPADGLDRVADGLRTGFARLARRLPGDGGDLLPGLSIGDETAVSTSLDQAMKSSSLSHLTAVSGANCAVVVAGAFLAAGLLRLPRLVRVAAALLVLAGFVVLVTPSASVVRAAVMASLVLVAVALGGLARGLPVLCAAVCLLLVSDPWLGGDYGFALSVLATGGLLVLAPMLATALTRWMPRWLALVVAVPLAAQLACQPVLVLLDPHVPLLGAVANLLAEPAAPVATVLGLVACLTAPIAPPLAVMLARLAWVPSAWIAAVARAASSFPELRPIWPAGLPGAAAAAGVVTLVVLAVPGVLRFGPVRLRRPSFPRASFLRSPFTGTPVLGTPDRGVSFPGTSSPRPSGEHARGVVVHAATVRMLATVLLAALLVMAGASRAGGDLGLVLTRPTDWTMAACDIGQGDAVMIRSPPTATRAAAVALVDVGPDPAPLTRCLAELGISRIDLLVLTHYDADHVGGLAAVVGRVGVAVVGRPADAHDQSLVADLVDGGADVHRGVAGDGGTLGGFRWSILWPEAGRATMSDGNEGSVTALFRTTGFSAVFLGDLDERAQDALLATGRMPAVDVVKVAHHGSADQSPELYARLRARLALVSVGADNDYGHPTARLLGILDDVGTTVERTDLEGLVLVSRSDGGALRIWSERAATDAQKEVPGPSGGDVGGHR